MELLEQNVTKAAGRWNGGTWEGWQGRPCKILQGRPSAFRSELSFCSELYTSSVAPFCDGIERHPSCYKEEQSSELPFQWGTDKAHPLLLSLCGPLMEFGMSGISFFLTLGASSPKDIGGRDSL